MEGPTACYLPRLVLRDLWHTMPIGHYRRRNLMPTRNVVLTDHQEELIEGLVSSGRYQNASEVLREGLRLVERREEENKARLKSLREAARLGIADIEGGRFRDFSASAELRAHLDTLARKTVRPATKR